MENMIRRSKLVAPLLVLLTIAFLASSFKADALSHGVVEEGDRNKINVSMRIYPDVDKFGKPSINPDGSFYPNDAFWVAYSIYVVQGVSLDGVEATYDQSTFEKVKDIDWGSLKGKALFKVKTDAKPGIYEITVRAWDSVTQNILTGSGTVKVTYGGAEVNAYYRAECRLTISSASGGTTSPAPGSYWYSKGSSVSVTAIPDSGYELSCWLLDGEDIGSSNPISVSMDNPHTLTAVFKKAQYSLTIFVEPTGGGATTPPPGTYYYDAGTQVQVTATPNANYTFSYWLLDGESYGSSSSTTVTMDKNHILTGFFSSGNATQQAINTQILALNASASTVLQSTAEPKLAIKNLKWTTWFDVFRGTVCLAKGYLYDSNGRAITYSDVVVEFRKKNVFTGATWIALKTVKTDGAGYFSAEDTCMPLTETFLGVEAWAEKPGYIPSWVLTVVVNPTSDTLEQGEGRVVGVEVFLSGRYTVVPITLSARNMPSGCTILFDPQVGSVDGLNHFEGSALLRASDSTQLGKFTIWIVASSGEVESSASFYLEVTEPQVESDLSKVTFSASGLDQDADGISLTVDGNAVYAGQLPKEFSWNVDSTHSYAWSNMINSTVDGKRYVLEEVVVTERYLSYASAKVEVVEYDPQFTLVLAYTIPKSPGNNSYEKPFAMIIRYDGNGPEKKLGQRAVIEGWDWWGYASERTEQQQLVGLTNLPDISKMSIEDLMKIMSNLTQLSMFGGGVTFSVAGINRDTEGTILKVDGESLVVDDLPKTYNWATNSTHTYEWSLQMPVYEWVVVDPMSGAEQYEKVDDEWFSFEYSLVFPPQLEGIENMTQEEFEKAKESLAQQFNSKIGSPRGNVTVAQTGNRVTGVYTHNKLLSSIAQSAGVSAADALKSLQPPFPIFFNNESKYAKVVFLLDDRVADKALEMSFNSSIFYEISFMSSAFTIQPHIFKANYTCPLEYYRKAVNATAVRWDPIAKNWIVDRTVRIEALFDTAFNFTETDWLKDWLKEQTPDETALKMAYEDLCESTPQYFEGLGTALGVMNRTSPYYYNLNVTAGHGAYTVGSVPTPADVWTESLKTHDAWWTSSTSTLSADTGRKIKGTASIKVEENEAGTASATLNLVRPIEATPITELRFKIYLGSGCNGKLTVYLSGDDRVEKVDMVEPLGSWTDVVVSVMPNKVTRIGIYAELQEGHGVFWADDLRFVNVKVWKWTDSKSLEKTVKIDFSTDKPYKLYVNMDPLSPLSVNVTSDDCKTSRLTVDALPELGGLANITVYAITTAPSGYSLGNLPLNKLTLRLLKTVNLTTSETSVPPVENFTFYLGYAPAYEAVLGFQGQTEILIVKDPTMLTLPGYNATLLLVEAQNVWGTKFYRVMSVEPYGKTFHEVLMDQIAIYATYIIIAAIIISLVIHFIKQAKGSE
jgi:hypothetical protein